MSVEESNEELIQLSNVFALDEPVINLLFALLFIVVCVIPVKFAPFPIKLVAVHTPVTLIPFGKLGAPNPLLSLIVFTLAETSNSIFF